MSASIQTLPASTKALTVSATAPVKYPPTIEFEKQNQFYELLSTNGGCELPCVWGVVPGETSLKDAINIIGNYSGEYEFSPYMLSGTEPRYEYSDNFDVTTRIDIGVFLEFDTSGEKVRGVSVSFSLSEGGYSTLADENFEIYSILELFRKYGIPDNIYLYPPKVSQSPEGYGIYVFYEEEKIMLSYSGSSTEIDKRVYKLCPNIGDGDIGGLHLVTADPNDPLIHMIPYGWDDFSLAPSLTLTTPLKLNPNDLYDLFINKNTYCFTYDRNLLQVIYAQ